MKSIGRFALRYQTLALFQTHLGNRSCARISSHAARAILLMFERRGLIYEVTGRGSFRCYSAMPVMNQP